MIDNNFENEILNKIKGEKIAPIPRWHFLLKDYVILGLGGLALFIGACSFSVILYLLQNNDWQVYDRLSDSLPGFVVLTLPYFWIILLLVFLVIVNYNLKHTKRGYKFSIPLIGAATIFISLFFGTMFFYAGFGLALDDMFGARFPMYERFMNRPMMLWENPAGGRLSGLVVSRLSDCEFQLFDRLRREWTINIERTKNSCAETVEIGRPIKTLGQLGEENYFFVEVILPHGPGRGMFHRMEMMEPWGQ